MKPTEEQVAALEVFGLRRDVIMLIGSSEDAKELIQAYVRKSHSKPKPIQPKKVKLKNLKGRKYSPAVLAELRNTPAVIEAFRTLPYKEYLQTEWWKRIRQAAIRRADYACQRCHKRCRLDVHHKTYIRLGTERDEDLEALCRTCHNIEHGLAE